MQDKLREYFEDMVVYKDLKESNFFKSLSLPAFLRDWLLKMFEDEDGHFDVTEMTDFIHQYIPSKVQWTGIKNRIVKEGETVKLLTRISIDIDIKTQDVTFSLPDFGLNNKETLIEDRVWDECKDELVKAKESWGIIELGYRYPEGNADGYETEAQKLAMLTRLLPFVEKRVNLIELAPKGTGKSYVFGGISRYGYLCGGKMTRAKLFYDLARREEGLVFYHDFIAFDEISKVEFDNPNEMVQTLLGYMEQGTVKIGDKNDVAEAGVVMLGNIDQEDMDEWKNMFAGLPSFLKNNSALIDRIHGFVKGWDIPRMNEGLKICGWALNSEYFTSIMHMLRDDVSYRAIVDRLVDYPADSDTRNTEAVKRIATAYLKLLFPHVRTAEDVKPREFNQYCLRPAFRMREIVLRQMGMLDVEYKGKEMPKFSINPVGDES